MDTNQLTKQLMEQIVEKCRYRKPDTEYYYVPINGWYTMSYEPVPCPRIMDTEQNPYTGYHIFIDDSMWRLHRDTGQGQYVVSRMKLCADAGIIYRFWVLSSDELVELMLDFICRQRTSLEMERPLRARNKMTEQLVQRIIATWRDREPTVQCRLVPNDGWYTLDGDRVPYLEIWQKDLEPYKEYSVVHENAIWVLHKDTALHQHVLCRMEIDMEADDTDPDSVVFSFWVMDGDELASLLMDFIRTVS